MASRRMFAISILGSDAFLDLPPSTQALYVQLCMNADDDGFLNNATRIARMIGAGGEDLNRLIEKRFVLSFDSGVIVIKHWRMHNAIRADRKKQTSYKAEMESLSIRSDGAYTEKRTDSELDGHLVDNPQPIDNQLTTNCQPNVNQVTTNIEAQVSTMSAQDRTGETKTGEERLLIGQVEERGVSHPTVDAADVQPPPPPPLEKKATLDPDGFVERFRARCPSFGMIYNLSSKRRDKIARLLAAFTTEQLEDGLDRLERSAFLKGKNKNHWKATFDWLICQDNFTKLLEGNYDDWKAPRDPNQTFDADEFFEAALQRGNELLGDRKEEP